MRYLPKQGVWPAIDAVNPFRVQSPDEFALGLPTGLIVANAVIALACVLLVRRGAGFPKVT